MPRLRPLLPVLAVAAALLVLLAAGPGRTAAADEPLAVTARVAYSILPDPASSEALGPVHVSWQVSVENKDPQTARDGGDTIFFYDSLPLPVLRGASALSARSAAGADLPASLDPAGEGPLQVATVAFDRMLFFGDSYSFTFDYALPSARQEALLVTPFYVFLPAVASGDQATVSIATPGAGGWDVTLEPMDCPQDGSSFTCAGAGSVHLAAFAEVSRPEAIASIPISLALKEREVSLTLTHFQGEETWAQHLQALVTAALPVIEELAGFPYAGPAAINVAERGRRDILGYEGLTSCDPASACDIAVSPLASDFTVLHELAHLWSDIYSRRWLAEGFAELIAREAAARLPPGLVQGEPFLRPQSGIDLRLDEWGSVTTTIGASEEELLIEDAGYDRSLRFLLLLEQRLGLAVLQQVSAAIAQSGLAADSRLFMDVLEDLSGQKQDQLFAQWVFPDSESATLATRRLARDRLASLTTRAQAEGLSSTITDAILGDVAAWRFQEALDGLERAEAAFQTYLDIKDALTSLRADIQAAGLSFPQTIEAALERWDFQAARLSVRAAGDALDAYLAARDKVNASRNLWERLGLLGRDPDGDLADAEAAFARGDFQRALEEADSAAGAIDGAARAAALRLLIVLGVLAALAGAAAALWQVRRRSRWSAGV